MNFQSIPVIRIFDEAKAREFYLEYLGMKLDWEHKFADDYPIYMQVSRDNLILHLTEHAGDCTPGGKVFVYAHDFEALYADLKSRKSKFTKPHMEKAPWGGRSFTALDPFSNKILFAEVTDS